MRSNSRTSSWAQLLLGCGLLFRSGLLLRRGLILRSSSLLLGSSLLGLGGLLLVVGADFVGVLYLHKNAIGNHLLQGTQEHGIQPLLIGGESGLHGLLDGNGG